MVCFSSDLLFRCVDRGCICFSTFLKRGFLSSRVEASWTLSLSAPSYPRQQFASLQRPSTSVRREGIVIMVNVSQAVSTAVSEDSLFIPVSGRGG